jgi:PAS domain S-box-containing protein
MFSGIKNRSQWMAAMPVPTAFVAFALFVWATARTGLAMQMGVAALTAAALLLQHLAIERSRARDREHMLALLRVLNRPGDLHDLLREVTGFLQTWAGCEAVGVRLKDGADFPYFESRGFSKQFVRAENHLCTRDLDGALVRDAAGNPLLECMCGNVLCDRFDPSQPFFTSKGSFFSNHTSQLLASTSEGERQARTRNRCNGEGYESVALIPLKLGNRTLGLLQLNDRRKDRFSASRLRFFEEIADVVALSLGQRNAQALLVRSEVQYRQIVETAEEGVMTLDESGKLTYLSARFAAMLASTVEAAQGRSLEQYLFADDVPAYRELLRDLRAKRTGKFEARLRHGDGSFTWCLFSARPNLGDGGQFLGSFATVFDTSERKQAEAERERLQTQLLQAQKLESIGRLAGGVAHDFNNMLSVINGHAEMALEQIPKADPLHEDLWNILNAGRRSATLTRQLLAFARQQTIQPRVVNINQIVSSMLKLLSRLIGEDIELVWSPEPVLWRVRVDPAQIDQLLANLAVNARDAIAGVGKVHLATTNEELTATECAAIVGSAPGHYVRLSISDTGCGMDPATVEHIFEPFFTTKKVGEGTGLGLAMVYGVVSQNQGFVSVYSEIGKGTTFHIYLPRCQSTLTTTSENDSIVQAPTGSETVLIVEDEEAVLSLVQARLHNVGYRVLAASSPEQALRLAGEHTSPIDLLLTDLVMPGMNGRELARKLGLERPQLKYLYMSGYPADVAAHQGILENGLHLIQKPFSLRALTQKVREVLDESRIQS